MTIVVLERKAADVMPAFYWYGVFVKIINLMHWKRISLQCLNIRILHVIFVPHSKQIS
jgi:hypothetical protein